MFLPSFLALDSVSRLDCLPGPSGLQCPQDTLISDSGKSTSSYCPSGQGVIVTSCC